jgi:peptidoglycan-associated lipoprotein
MIPNLRGPRGWTEVTRVRRSGTSGMSVALAGLCLVAALAPGCSRRAPATGQDLAGGLTDEGLGLGDGSLDRAREGHGPAEDGVLRDVHFAFDSEDLDDVARAILDDNALWLRDNPKTRVEVEGHCDNRGTIEYNLALGARRARAVQEYLTGQGVAGDRITTISYGKELPLCQEETEECWARNRRAHSVVGGR